MLKSFIYMFKDTNFWKKYLSLFGVVLIANLLINWSGTLAPAIEGDKASIWYYILFFTGLIVMFIPYGYSISALKTKLDETKELPSLDIVKNFVAGLKVFLSGLILLAVVLIFAFVLLVINSIITDLLGTQFGVVSNAILFLMLLIVAFFCIAMCCRYVVKPSYLNFLNFKAAAKLINSNVSKYFKSFVLTALSTAVIYLITFISVSYLTLIGYAGLVIYCIIVSLLWSYQIYLFAGLFSSAVDREKI